jgi:hypothetical protein
VLNREQDSLDDLLFSGFKSTHIVPAHLNQILDLLLLHKFPKPLENVIVWQLLDFAPRFSHERIKDLPAKLIMKLMDYLVA